VADRPPGRRAAANENTAPSARSVAASTRVRPFRRLCGSSGFGVVLPASLTFHHVPSWAYTDVSPSMSYELRYVETAPNEPPTARPATTSASRPASNVVTPPLDGFGGAATPLMGVMGCCWYGG
jgi:hypothetical protein